MKITMTTGSKLSPLYAWMAQNLTWFHALNQSEIEI